MRPRKFIHAKTAERLEELKANGSLEEAKKKIEEKRAKAKERQKRYKLEPDAPKRSYVFHTGVPEHKSKFSQS
jgi:hypothetical protein